MYSLLGFVVHSRVVKKLMLTHILNETSYHLQSVLVEEGLLTLLSVFSQLIEASTHFASDSLSLGCLSKSSLWTG